MTGLGGRGLEVVKLDVIGSSWSREFRICSREGMMRLQREMVSAALGMIHCFTQTFPDVGACAVDENQNEPPNGMIPLHPQSGVSYPQEILPLRNRSRISIRPIKVLVDGSAERGFVLTEPHDDSSAGFRQAERYGCAKACSQV